MAEDLSFDIPEGEMTEPLPPKGDEFEEPSTEESEAQTEESEAQTEESEAQTEESEVKKEPRMVELGALHEERQRRKEAEERISRMEERFEQFKTRLETPPETAEKDALPDFDEDPATNLNERLRRQEEQLKQQQQFSAQQQQLSQFISGFNTREAAFAQETPDYYSAAQYLRELRSNHYQMMGYPPETAKQYVDQEAIQLAIAMTQNGVDPAEKFYEMAKSAGYTTLAASAPKQETEETIRQQATNVSRATSTGSRGQSTKQPSLTDLANMSDEDFDKFTSGNNWSRLWQ